MYYSGKIKSRLRLAGIIDNIVKRALFSLGRQENTVGFARALKNMGWHIIATVETVNELKKHNMACEDISHFTGITKDYGFPPTLHAKVESALTTDAPYRIDLVYDIPYTLDQGNDVGGRTLLALGAKGRRIVACEPEQIREIIHYLKKSRTHSNIPASLRRDLIDKVNLHITRHYIDLISDKRTGGCGALIGRPKMPLLWGENPYQRPADLLTTDKDDNLSLPEFRIINKNIPCFTNMADLDSVLQTLSLAAEAFKKNCGKIPYISIASKHGNPCGMAVDWKSPKESMHKALFGNPTAVWGGEFIVNFKIDKKLASVLHESIERKELLGNANWMLDVIAAPDFSSEAISILGKSKARKLFQNNALSRPIIRKDKWHFRQVRGGFLRQPLPDYVLNMRANKALAGIFKCEVIDSMIIAWSVAYSSYHGGNEIAIAGDRQLIGAGGGPSTLDAARTAVSRAEHNGHRTKGAVFAADAFFPFTDAPEILKESGCCYGVVPSGGKNYPHVKRYFEKNNIRVFYVPAKYRGFCRH
ncbi:MAG: hypothetical protein ABH843_05410 [Candidatus Omnitrophota bacterium]